MLVEVRHQPELSPGDLVLVIRRDEAEDVLVPEHDCLVDLGLPEPRLLVSAGEDLDGHIVPDPLPSPHLSVPALPHALDQADLPGDAPLDQQGVPRPGPAVALLQHLLHGGLALVQVGRHRGLLGAEIDHHGWREALGDGDVAELAPAEAVDQEQDEDEDEDEEDRHQDGQYEQHVVLIFFYKKIRSEFLRELKPPLQTCKAR